MTIATADVAALHHDGILTIAVASDLHAHSESEANPSHLKVLTADHKSACNPVSHLSQLIARERLVADLVLCPGDLGDKARPENIRFAWRCLQEIGAELKACLTTASSGNHDLDSRLVYHKYDPAETLQELKPPYPLPDEHQNDIYWSRKYVIHSTTNFRLVLFNSSAYHGGAGGEEYSHGRISNFTLKRLESELLRMPSVPVNILLCHHHPHQFPELHQDDDTYDAMKNGQALLELLGRSDIGRWIVIHGHKHHARIMHAAGTSSSPVVFSAGSFSAVIYPQLQTIARNQFYLVTIPLNNDMGLVGSIRSWDWTPAGWIPSAARGSGISSRAAFGCRDSPDNLARRIKDKVAGRAVVFWKDITTELPELDFILPQDLASVIEILSNRYLCEVVLTDEHPVQVGMRRSCSDIK